ncbi:GNAT family N-acetyltransferase [Pseudoduganella sp. GCM10020061]|uniref:GNAT family N-acetyltransferase n=1 Tax=Pseudoduganella sp. GCM10020061 TaxID=3317345 RepID=UPI003635266F
MNLVIRTATPEDASAACTVLRRSIVECCAEDHRNDPVVLDAWLGNKDPQTVAGWFASPANCSLLAELDGKVVGVGLVNQAGKLSLCYVLPEALHIGAGKALLRGLEQQARAWGVTTIRLNSTAAASAFYARNGYLHGGRERSCFGLECDFFWKKLDEPVQAGAAKQRFCGCSG